MDLIGERSLMAYKIEGFATFLIDGDSDESPVFHGIGQGYS